MQLPFYFFYSVAETYLRETHYWQLWSERKHRYPKSYFKKKKKTAPWNLWFHFKMLNIWVICIKLFTMTLSDQLSSLLSDFDVLQLSSLQQHSVRKRDVQSQTHAERLLSFTALQRWILITHVPPWHIITAKIKAQSFNKLS